MQEKPLDLIDPSPTNPRKKFDQEKMLELAASIKVNGVIQPVVIRPHPKEPARFELVAGERRYRASYIAKKESIPFVLRELADDEVIEIQLTENGGREDVSPLEEADAMLVLVNRFGRTAEEIADRLGRGIEYVRRRLRLGDLIEPLRLLVEQERIGIGAAELLSQSPTTMQEEIAEKSMRLNATGHGGELATWSKSSVRTIISRHSRDLERAQWDLDAPMGELPACHQCHERSGAQPSLLAEFNEDDRCLNGACWDAKKAKWWAEQSAAAEEAGHEVLEEEEAEELWNDWYRQRTYVRADDVCHTDPDRRTWGELAAEEVSRIVAPASPRRGGAPVQLVRKKEVIAHLKEHDEDLADQIRTSKSAAQRKADREQNRRRRDRMDQVIDWIRDRPTLDKTMIHAVTYAALKRAKSDTCREIRKRRELEKPDVDYDADRHAILPLLDEMTAAELFALLVELNITASSQHWTLSEDSPWWKWAELAGVDPDFKKNGADDE